MENIKEYVTNQRVLLKYDLEDYLRDIGREPVFYIVQVGDNEASNRYVRNKIKDCNEVGIKTGLLKLPESTSKQDLKALINTLNDEDNLVDAFMIQFPLPTHLNEEEVMCWINPKKDADGFTNNKITNPATPQGIITYLERNNYDFENKNALILGRSEIVGKPMAKLLLEKNCNITVIHSKTDFENKRKFIESADLIISATGRMETLTNNSLISYKPDAMVFDVGINFTEDGKLVGDCETNLPVAFQSTVPGGVGLLTRLQLLENIITLYKIRNEK